MQIHEELGRRRERQVQPHGAVLGGRSRVSHTRSCQCALRDENSPGETVRGTGITDNYWKLFLRPRDARKTSRCKTEISKCTAFFQTRYAWPAGSEEANGVEELKELDRNTLDTNEICYINGMIFFFFFFFQLRR